MKDTNELNLNPSMNRRVFLHKTTRVIIPSMAVLGLGGILASCGGGGSGANANDGSNGGNTGSVAGWVTSAGHVVTTVPSAPGWFLVTVNGHSATTDQATGYFTINNIPPGTYNILIGSTYVSSGFCCTIVSGTTATPQQGSIPNGCNGCASTCQDTCTSGCASGCQDSCTSSCTGSCQNTCTAGCAGGCTSGCSGSCSSTCSGSCRANCSSNCLGSCTNACTGVGCGWTCYQGA